MTGVRVATPPPVQVAADGLVRFSMSNEYNIDGRGGFIEVGLGPSKTVGIGLLK